MRESRTQMHRFEARSREFSRFGKGISLHSHTIHS